MALDWQTAMPILVALALLCSGRVYVVYVFLNCLAAVQVYVKLHQNIRIYCNQAHTAPL